MNTVAAVVLIAVGLAAVIFGVLMLYVIVSDKIDYDLKTGKITPEEARAEMRHLHRSL